MSNRSINFIAMTIILSALSVACTKQNSTPIASPEPIHKAKESARQQAEDIAKQQEEINKQMKEAQEQASPASANQ